MGRKILFITTDQQRYDALGCNGGRIARTFYPIIMCGICQPPDGGPPQNFRPKNKEGISALFAPNPLTGEKGDRVRP